MESAFNIDTVSTATAPLAALSNESGTTVGCVADGACSLSVSAAFTASIVHAATRHIIIL